MNNSEIALFITLNHSFDSFNQLDIYQISRVSKETKKFIQDKFASDKICK